MRAGKSISILLSALIRTFLFSSHIHAQTDIAVAEKKFPERKTFTLPT